MLVGGDLGFLFRVLVASLVVLLGPVLGLVVRLKWRRSLARKEEIKRLLVLASEEAARAELEAAAEYGYGYDYAEPVTTAEPQAKVEVSESVPAPVVVPALGQVQYQCAVCFSPTKTRCSQCKAVRYCSGRCQIIHWRKGHKDECHPFTIASEGMNVEGTLNLETSRPEEEEERCGNAAKAEVRHPPKLTESSSVEPESSSSRLISVSNLKEPVNVEHVNDQGGTSSNSNSGTHTFSRKLSASNGSIESSIDVSLSDSNDYDKSDSHISSRTNPNVVERGYSRHDHVKQSLSKQSLSKQSTLLNLAKSVNTSRKATQTKPECFTGSSQCGSSISSSRNTGSTTRHSLEETSVRASDFWEGTINRTRCQTDSLSETNSLHLSKDGKVNASSSQSISSNSSEFCRSVVSNVCEQWSEPEVVIPENHTNPSTEVTQNPTRGSASSVEISKDNLGSRISLVSRHNTSGCINSSSLSTKSASDTREHASSCSPLYAGSASSAREHSLLNGASAVKTNSGVVAGKDYLQTLKSREVESSHGVDGRQSHVAGRHTLSGRSLKTECKQVTNRSMKYGGQSQNSRSGLRTSMTKVVDQIRASKLAGHDSLVDGGVVTGTDDNKVPFPYELFVKLYNSNNVELRPFGLINCGNSCYANAVLQCLAFTPPLTAYFLQGIHGKKCGRKEWCFTCEFENIILKAREGNSPLSPIRIISHLEDIGSHLGHGKEEDAHEFLRCTVEAMQSSCLKEFSGGVSGSFDEERTLIGLTFGGYLRSKIECMRCGGKSERHERMMDLTVEISGEIGTLDDALRQFTHTETLDGENKYNCSRCKSYEKAKKKLRVLEAPNVLTIALKRFQSGKFGKLNKTIKFPEILNLAPYMSGTSDKSPIYRLYGVVVHLDVMNASFSGHYVCYVKNIQNKWFKVDDSSVKAVELEKVLERGAYMLLYARCSPRAPRLFRSSAVARDCSKAMQLARKSRDFQLNDSLNGQSFNGCICQNRSQFQQAHSVLEEDSSSDISSSLFSEVGSYSTDSSNRESTSTDEYFDHIFSDTGGCWNGSWRASSDSDTSSSSSSPSPLYSRHSPLADLDHYVSGHSAANCNGFLGRLPNRSSCEEVLEIDANAHFLCPDSTKHCRKLDSSGNCRERL